MKSILKILSCLVLVVMLVFSFAACSDNSEPAVDSNIPTSTNVSTNDPQLEKLVKDEGATFETTFEQNFGSDYGGLTCECKLSVDGTKLIVDCLVEGLNDVPAESRAQMQNAYDATANELSEAFKPFKDKASALSEVTLNVCEEDGDIIATVKMPF